MACRYKLDSVSWIVASLAALADHQYADTRVYFGVPHFWNVLSNVPFLVIGIMGLRLHASAAWKTLFAGSVLVCFGSAYYHWAPDDDRLVWDRIPIGIGFAGLFAALIEEHGGKRLLVPFLAVAIAAVLWWRASGDLSAWVFVQLVPMLGIVFALWRLPARYPYRRYFGYALGWYALAKLFELADHQVMGWTAGAMGGHALKHFAAAAGVWCFYRMLKLRSS